MKKKNDYLGFHGGTNGTLVTLAGQVLYNFDLEHAKITIRVFSALVDFPKMPFLRRYFSDTCSFC